MEPIYRREFVIDDMVSDCFGRLKMSSALSFIQEMAGAHVRRMALAPAPEEMGLLWVIVRHRLQLSRIPMRGERIHLETWPLPTTRSAYPRSVVAYDEQGKELFRSISLWVLMDSRSRNLVLPGKSGIIVPGTLRGNELEVPRSLLPALCSASVRRRVGFCELDSNLHMNNSRYLDWAQDLLPAAFHREHFLQDATMCYLSEAREGEELEVAWEMGRDNVLHVDIQRCDENRKTHIFTADLHYSI